jgi:hypothetical protein
MPVDIGLARRAGGEEQVVTSLQTLMCLYGKSDSAPGAPGAGR